MSQASATDWISAIGAILVPIVGAIIALRFGRARAKSEALTAVRLDYYRELGPKVNRVMCYLTFIGRWKEISPPAAVALKRECDEIFHVAKPLFSEATADAYEDFMASCFTPYGAWGSDARINSSAARRRSHTSPWNPEWDAWFLISDGTEVSEESLTQVGRRYDALLGALARDIQLQEPRSNYTTRDVVINAHHDSS